jgi:DNA-binding response OmpR family regulator
MPDQEGIETILQLKRRERAPKVIAISGGGRRAGQDFLEWARHLGADATLPKPFRTSEIIELARVLLENRRPSESAAPEEDPTPARARLATEWAA